MINEVPDQCGSLTQEELQRLVMFYEILMRVEQRNRLKQNITTKGGLDGPH